MKDEGRAGEQMYAVEVVQLKDLADWLEARRLRIVRIETDWSRVVGRVWARVEEVGSAKWEVTKVRSGELGVTKVGSGKASTRK